MDNEKLINFIAGKIKDIQYAIFYCHSNHSLQINNTIINSSKVDDRGRIVFFINRPTQSLSQAEQEFPVGLNYFQKGKNYFMNILGSGKIISDPKEIANETALQNNEVEGILCSKVLVVVTISKVDFYDTDFERKNLFLKKMWSVFSKLFDWFGSASRSYKMREPTPLHNYGF